MMATYGLMAMIAYGLGGPLADRFSPRKLLALSLVATGLQYVFGLVAAVAAVGLAATVAIRRIYR
jgi:sugar phosphate permease